MRALRNVDDIMKAGGMERCCYFFWLGNDCSINEEGATAVMTIELDKEKGPQVSIEFYYISFYDRNKFVKFSEERTSSELQFF